MLLKRKYNFFHYCLVVILCYWPFSAFAYTDRALIEYFTNNILWHLLVRGGYYTLGSLLLALILSMIFKTFRVYALSFSIAFCFLYLLILIYEVLEAMSWLPPMYR